MKIIQPPVYSRNVTTNRSVVRKHRCCDELLFFKETGGYWLSELEIILKNKRDSCHCQPRSPSLDWKQQDYDWKSTHCNIQLFEYKPALKNCCCPLSAWMKFGVICFCGGFCFRHFPQSIGPRLNNRVRFCSVDSSTFKTVFLPGDESKQNFWIELVSKHVYLMFWGVLKSIDKLRKDQRFFCLFIVYCLKVKRRWWSVFEMFEIL